MAPKHDVSADQGSFFAVETVGSGFTELDQYSTHSELSGPHPEGLYADSQVELPPVESDPLLLDRIRQEGQRRRNHAAQAGRHSALDEHGRYTDIRPGKVLKGFGIIYNNNLTDAYLHADKLNAELDAKDRRHG